MTVSRSRRSAARASREQNGEKQRVLTEDAPVEVVRQLSQAGLNHRPVLLSTSTDVALDGSPEQNWLVVSDERSVTGPQWTPERCGSVAAVAGSGQVPRLRRRWFGSVAGPASRCVGRPGPLLEYIARPLPQGGGQVGAAADHGRTQGPSRGRGRSATMSEMPAAFGGGRGDLSAMPAPRGHPQSGLGADSAPAPRHARALCVDDRRRAGRTGAAQTSAVLGRSRLAGTSDRGAAGRVFCRLCFWW